MISWFSTDSTIRFGLFDTTRLAAIMFMKLGHHLFNGVADLAVWAIDKQIESMGKLSEAERKEAKRLWALRQAAAISSISSTERTSH